MKNAAPKLIVAAIIDQIKNMTAKPSLARSLVATTNPKNIPKIIDIAADQPNIRIIGFIRSPKVKSILIIKDAFSIVNAQIVSGGNNKFRMLPVSLPPMAQHQ
jgi:hypothetical protein